MHPHMPSPCPPPNKCKARGSGLHVFRANGQQTIRVHTHFDSRSTADGNQSHSPRLQPPALQKDAPVDMLAVYTRASYFERHQIRKIVVQVVVDVGLAQQRSRDAAAASSAVEMIRVADSETESEEFAYISDGEHKCKEKALVLASILDESALTAEETSPRLHLSTTELDRQSKA